MNQLHAIFKYLINAYAMVRLSILQPLEHVEVFPIHIKLDYKPKRVDYNALRDGKTIEMMNFFHFDGAEMVLRHTTLSGVSD